MVGVLADEMAIQVIGQDIRAILVAGEHRGLWGAAMRLGSAVSASHTGLESHSLLKVMLLNV